MSAVHQVYAARFLLAFASVLAAGNAAAQSDPDRNCRGEGFGMSQKIAGGYRSSAVLRGAGAYQLG